MGSPLTVVLAEDHPVVRRGLVAELGDGFDVVGEADTAPAAVRAVQALRPDLLVCDLGLPGGGGLAVVRACAPHTRVVVLTVSEAQEDLLEAVAAGALGYLTKRTPTDELRAALLRAAAGEPVFTPELAVLLLGEFRRLARLAAPAERPLSDRERQVLVLVARGHTYREIGAELYISPKTVENHVRNVLDKLHLSRREQLVRYALEHGLE